MYSFNLTTAGQASTYRFLAVFNPIESGKQLMVHQATVTGYATVTVGSATPVTLSRITSSTSGSLQAASDINKFVSTYPDSITEVRTGNPTVTTGPRIYSFAPPVQGLTIGALSPNPQSVKFKTELIISPGEGFAFHQTTSGLAGHQYAIYACWVEQPI